MTTGWTTKGWFSAPDDGMHPAAPLPKNITEKYTEDEIFEADEMIFEGEDHEVARRRYWRLFHVDLPRGIMFELSGDLVHMSGLEMYIAWQAYHCKHPILASWIYENPGATLEAFWRMYPELFTPGKGSFEGLAMPRENNVPSWTHPEKSARLTTGNLMVSTMVFNGDVSDDSETGSDEDDGEIINGSDWERYNEFFGDSSEDSEDDLARELSTSMSVEDHQ